MAQPEFSGGGDDSELDKAFWEVIDGADIEVELAVQGSDEDYPRLWMGNICVAVDPFSGETFRETMVRTTRQALAWPDVRERGESAVVTQALRQELASPTARIRASSRVGFRGMGIAQAAPTPGRNTFRQVTVDEDLFIIGCLEDVIFDQYWQLKSKRAYHVSADGKDGGEYRQTWTGESHLGAVAVLGSTRLYASGGALIELFERLRVPLGEPLLQPLEVHEAGV